MCNLKKKTPKKMRRLLGGCVASCVRIRISASASGHHQSPKENGIVVRPPFHAPPYVSFLHAPR